MGFITDEFLTKEDFADEPPVQPMSVERYKEWCAENGITPNPDYGKFDPEPPF